MILDVREVDEFAGHIEGALSAPLSTLDKGEIADSPKLLCDFAKVVCVRRPASS